MPDMLFLPRGARRAPVGLRLECQGVYRGHTLREAKNLVRRKRVTCRTYPRRTHYHSQSQRTRLVLVVCVEVSRYMIDAVLLDSVQ